MSSSSSIFSLTLFAHFLRRFWPFMAALVVLLVLYAAELISGVTFVLSSMSVESMTDSARMAATTQMLAVPVLCVAGAPACLVAALMCFRHLRDRAEMQFYMDMPFSRTCLFLTTCISTFCLVAIPVAAVAAVVAIFELAGGLAAALPSLGMAVVACACGLVLFGGLAAFSCVITGRIGGAVLSYACFNVAAVALYGASAQALQQILVGVPLDSGDLFDAILWLTPVAKLMASAVSDLGMGGWPLNFNDPVAFAVYAAVGIALTVAAWVLYRLRPAESTGETMAFSGARIAFQVLASLVIAALGTMLSSFWGLQRSMNVMVGVRFGVCMVVFAAIGWFATEMFMRRTPRVFDLHSLAGCASIVGVLVVVLASMSLDIFGIVRWVPDSAQVERVEVRYDGVTGEVTPAAAVAVHHAVLDNRKLLEQQGTWHVIHSVNVDYDMADGSHVERSYRLYDLEETASAEVWDAARAALDNPDAIYRATFGTNRELTFDDIDEVNYELFSGDLGTEQSHEGNWAPFSRGDAFRLYQAVARDIREGNATRFTSGLSEEDNLGNIAFELMPGAVEVAGEDASGGDTPGGRASSSDLLAPIAGDSSGRYDKKGFKSSLPITAKMEHTLEWIRDFELRADWQDRSEGARTIE